MGSNKYLPGSNNTSSTSTTNINKVSNITPLSKFSSPFSNKNQNTEMIKSSIQDLPKTETNSTTDVEPSKQNIFKDF